MSSGNLLTLFGILSGILLTSLGIIVPVFLSIFNRKNDTIEKLKEANLNYRFSIMQHQATAEANLKILDSLPIPKSDGDSS